MESRILGLLDTTLRVQHSSSFEAADARHQHHSTRQTHLDINTSYHGANRKKKVKRIYGVWLSTGDDTLHSPSGHVADKTMRDLHPSYNTTMTWQLRFD